MNRDYKKIYKPKEIIEKTEKQNIYSGYVISHPENTVIINEIYEAESNLPEDVFQDLRTTLPNLIHFEKKSGKSIFVHSIPDGVPVANIHGMKDVTDSFKINMIEEYLKIVKTLKVNHKGLWANLAGKDYFNIDRETRSLYHSGVLKLNEDKEIPDGTFDDVKESISLFALSVLESADNQKSKLTELVKEYFMNLQAEGTATSIDEIQREVRKIYIYDVFLNEKKKEKKSEEKIEEKKKSFHISKNVAIVASVVLLVAVLATMTFGSIISSVAGEGDPLAAFDKERSDNTWLFINKSVAFGNRNDIEESLWEIYSEDELISTFTTKDINIAFSKEGVYTVSLTVTDKSGHTSKPYTEDIHHSKLSTSPLESDEPAAIEKLDNFTFSGSVQYDGNIFRGGSKSLRFDFQSKQSKDFTISNIFVDNTTKFSLWMRSGNANKEITLTVIGYNNGAEMFSLEKTYVPNDDLWHKIEMETNTNLATKIMISVTASDNIIWIDDIEINSYK